MIWTFEWAAHMHELCTGGLARLPPSTPEPATPDGIELIVKGRASVSRCGDVYENKVTGEHVLILRGSQDRGDGPAIAYLTLQPGGAVLGEHTHPALVERFTVIKGRLDARIGGKDMALSSGQSITAPAGVAHDWWNASPDQEAHILVEVDVAPGASHDGGDRFEMMIGTMFGLANDGKVDRKGRPNPLQAVLVLREFADVIAFTQPPRWVQSAMIAVLAPVGSLLGYRAIYPEYLRPHSRETPTPEQLALVGAALQKPPFAPNVLTTDS